MSWERLLATLGWGGMVGCGAPGTFHAFLLLVFVFLSIVQNTFQKRMHFSSFSSHFSKFIICCDFNLNSYEEMIDYEPILVVKLAMQSPKIARFNEKRYLIDYFIFSVLQNDFQSQIDWWLGFFICPILLPKESSFLLVWATSALISFAILFTFFNNSANRWSMSATIQSCPSTKSLKWNWWIK